MELVVVMETERYFESVGGNKVGSREMCPLPNPHIPKGVSDRDKQTQGCQAATHPRINLKNNMVLQDSTYLT